jgi:formamidopyrimidine-DNA glycosylase
MPELPEVETIANGVDRRLRGDTILSTWFSSYKEPFKTAPADLADALTGRRIVRVRRVGKHIVVDLEKVRPGRRSSSNPNRKVSPSNREAPSQDAKSPLDAQSQWVVHLGMTGRLLVSGPDIPVAPHTHAILHLASGRELRFVDPRRFGRLALAATPFNGPGSEPLTISADEFAALFHGRKLDIKAALLNQSLLHGVGNIYADESLFRAGIRPTRVAGRLPRLRLDRLRTALRAVLKSAIRAGGSSVSDYVDADGEAGFFQIQHRVYGREGQPCRVCGTPIRRIVLAGRSSHFCPHCQK